MKQAMTIFITILVLACGQRATEESMATPAIQQTMTVTSPVFTDGGAIPRKYGCGGESIAPPLTVGGVPKSAKTLALIVTDPDAPGGTFTHWLAWNIPSSKASFDEGQATGGVEGKNGYGKTGYGPPCPPSGTHHYRFDVYALDSSLNLDPSAQRGKVEKAISGHIVAQGRIVGTYSK
jgi:Raf kinase inhibitor-like YbhB/YbcL family protein